MSKRKKYSKEHKELFMALFDGTADINNMGVVCVGNKEWNFTDPDLIFLNRQANQLKKDMGKLAEEYVNRLFGED